MTKKNSKKRRRITFYTFILFAIIIGIILTLPNYISQIRNKYKEKDKLEETLTIMQKEQKTLEKEVLQLSDSNYIAKIARQKYLLSKDGEIIIKIEDEKIINEEVKNSKTLLTGENIIIISVIIFILGIKLIRKTRKTHSK